MDNKLQLFENKRIRHEWDEEKEELFFSVIDVVAVLTNSDYQTARKYWKNMKSRMIKEGATFQLVTDCYQLKQCRALKIQRFSKSLNCPRARFRIKPHSAGPIKLCHIFGQNILTKRIQEVEFHLALSANIR